MHNYLTFVIIVRVLLLVNLLLFCTSRASRGLTAHRPSRESMTREEGVFRKCLSRFNEFNVGVKERKIQIGCSL